MEYFSVQTNLLTQKSGCSYQAFVSDRDGNLPNPPESDVVGSRATLA